MILELHAETQGNVDLPPLIILHGLFGSCSNWRSIARKLSGHYHVSCLDLRNHGRSPWHDDMTYYDLAGDVVHYLRKHDLENPVLLGHSMGGKTVMTMLQEYKVSAAHAFIVDIAPVSYAHNHDQLIHAMQSVDFESAKSRADVDSELQKSVDDPSLRQFLLQNLRQGDAGLCWRINLQSILDNSGYLFDYSSDSSVDVDAVFVSGGNSEYILPQHHETILSLFTNARIETIPGVGHWLHAEQPQALLDLVMRNKHHHDEIQPG